MRRAQRRKYHYIYKTTCTITSRYYYGMHSTDNLNDGYIGSGKRLGYSINKYGKTNHIKEILEYLPSREKLKEREEKIVNEELINDPLCMNLQIGGGGGYINEEHMIKCVKAGAAATNKLRWKDNREENLKKISYESKERWKNEEFRNKILDKFNFKNRNHSNESKKRIGEKNSIKQSGEKNSQYGTCWITNEKENKKIYKGDLIPEKWRLGRKINK